MEQLFAHFEADEVEFEFSATERNGPLQEFLSTIGSDLHLLPVRVTRPEFSEKFPQLPHTVIENGSNREQTPDLLYESLS